MRGFRLVNTRWPTGKNECERVQLADTLGRYIMAHDPGEGVPLADPPGDELDVLRPEIQDQDGPRRGIGLLHELVVSTAWRIGDRDDPRAVIETYTLAGARGFGNRNRLASRIRGAAVL